MNTVTGKSENGNLHNLTVSLEYDDFWQDWMIVMTGRSANGAPVNTRWHVTGEAQNISWWKFAASVTADHIDTYNFVTAKYA